MLCAVMAWLNVPRHSSEIVHGGATWGIKPGRKISPECIIRANRCTHGTLTLSVFHTRRHTPPGNRTLSSSRHAWSVSSQCHVCAHVAAVRHASVSPVDSARDRMTGTWGRTCHTRRGHFRRRVRCENATRKALVKIYRQRARTCAYIEYPQRGIKIAVTSLAHVAREEINNLSGVARAHRTIVRHPAVKGVGSFHTVLGGGKSRAITLRSGRNLLAGRIRRPRWCHRVRIAIGRMRKAASIRVYMHNTSPTVAASIIIVSD